jgi:hypothetical protein
MGVPTGAMADGLRKAEQAIKNIARSLLPRARVSLLDGIEGRQPVAFIERAARPLRVIRDSPRTGTGITIAFDWSSVDWEALRASDPEMMRKYSELSQKPKLRLRLIGLWRAFDFGRDPTAGHAPLFQSLYRMRGRIRDLQQGWGVLLLPLLEVAKAPTQTRAGPEAQARTKAHSSTAQQAQYIDWTGQRDLPALRSSN